MAGRPREAGPKRNPSRADRSPTPDPRRLVFPKKGMTRLRLSDPPARFAAHRSCMSSSQPSQQGFWCRSRGNRTGVAKGNRHATRVGKAATDRVPTGFAALERLAKHGWQRALSTDRGRSSRETRSTEYCVSGRHVPGGASESVRSPLSLSFSCFPLKKGENEMNTSCIRNLPSRPARTTFSLSLSPSLCLSNLTEKRGAATNKLETEIAKVRTSVQSRSPDPAAPMGPRANRAGAAAWVLVPRQKKPQGSVPCPRV